MSPEKYAADIYGLLNYSVTLALESGVWPIVLFITRNLILLSILWYSLGGFHPKHAFVCTGVD